MKTDESKPATNIIAAVDALEKAVQAQTVNSTQSAVSTQDAYRATLAKVADSIKDALAAWKSSDGPAKLQACEKLSRTVSASMARMAGRLDTALGTVGEHLSTCERYQERTARLITQISPDSSKADHREIQDLLLWGADYGWSFLVAFGQLEQEAATLASRVEQELARTGITPPSHPPAGLAGMVPSPQPPVVKLTGWDEIYKP